MKRKVRIKALPKARQGGYINPIPGAHPGYNGAYGPPDSYFPSDNGSEESTEVNRTLKPTSREHANLEAEKGETVITNLSQGGIPEFYNIGGKRHYDGGTPLNLPADSFIFSRDRKMKIKDKDVLAQFGITNAKKGGVTPADISKKYDINKYRKILADPSSDRYQRETAEMMIENYNYKLGGLAMVQESMKGFPNGVPAVAVPYLEQNGIDPSQLIPDMFPEQGGQMPMARYGGQNYFVHGGEEDEGGAERITSFDFTNIKDPLEYLHNINTTSSDKGIARVVDKTSFFNQWNKQPQAANLQYAEDDGNWNLVRNSAVPSIRQGYTPPPARPHKPIKFFHSTPGNTIPYSSKEEVVMPTFEPGGPKIDYTSKTARNSMAITPGTQNINPNILTPRDTTLARQYEWYKDYTPIYDPTDPKKMDVSDPLQSRKKALNAELLDIRRGMAKTYGLPTTKDGLPDYEQIDPNIILDKSKMDPAQLQRMYDIMYEKRAIRDAQGFQRKQFYGDLEAEQKGYSSETPLEDLNLGIRFATGVQSQQLKELADKQKEDQLASLTLKKYGGDASGKKKVRIKLPEYAAAGEVAISNKPTRWQNVPKNKVRWDITKPGYDPAKVEAGDYVKKDGKWYLITGRNTKVEPFTGELIDDSNLVSDKGDLREGYSRLVQRIETNPELKNAIINNYKKTVSELKPRKHLSQADIDRLKALADDPQAVLDNFYEAQKQMLAVNAQVGAAKDFAENWDTDRSVYEKTVSDMGYTPLDNVQTAAFQAAYVGLQNLADDPKFKSTLADFNVGQWGKADEPGGGTGKTTISDVDGWMGNTTIGQVAVYEPTATDLAMKEAEWKEAAADTEHLADPAYAGQTPFWTQDLVNFGQAVMNRYNIPRFEPYEAKAPVRLPKATFMDPMQQVQNILGSQSNVLDVASTYATPGGFAATAGLLHGQSANAVANAIANVHNQNVQIANQFELQRNNILNRAAERDAQLATRLHDKYNILNQQLANSKKQASAEIWKQFNNMWTNRGITQTMNELYDQYNVDPVTGYTYMGPGRDLQAKDVSSKDISTVANDLMSSIPGLDAKDALAAAQKQLGYSPTQGTGVDPKQFMYPGGMGYGYFPQD